MSKIEFEHEWKPEYRGLTEEDKAKIRELEAAFFQEEQKRKRPHEIPNRVIGVT